MRYLPKGLPRKVEFRYGRIPVDQYIKLHAARLPGKVAINYYGKEITYGELDRYIDCFATFLRKSGIKKGDTVALFMQNCPQYIISFYGAQRIGAIVAPCSPMFKEWELEYELNQAEARVIVANDYLYPIVESVKGKTQLEKVVLTSFADFLPASPTIPLGPDMSLEKPRSLPKDAFDFVQVIRDTVPEPELIRTDIDVENDVCLLVFTSGTTGLPKGAMLTYQNALYKAVATGTAYHFTEYSTFLNTQPLFHIAGMVFMHIQFYNGSTMILLTRYTPEAVMTAIDRYKCDRWYGTALMNYEVANHPEVGRYNLCSLRINPCTSFGIQLTRELADRWSELTRGGILLEAAYGLSESHTMDTLMPIERVKYGSTGIPMFEEMEVRILDFETGKECEVGETGEIVVRNPGVFKGYLKNPEATAKALKDGWLYTGDVGRLDEEGYLYFLGRRKEMIKSSGYSVFPEEVELYLLRHEAVAQVAVVGKPDPVKGEIVKAFVVLKEGYRGRVTEQEIVEWARDKMAAYKRPREVEFRESLPVTGPGKLLRRVLAEEERRKFEERQAN